MKEKNVSLFPELNEAKKYPKTIPSYKYTIKFVKGKMRGLYSTQKLL